MKAIFFESLPYESDFRVGSHHYASRFAAAGWDVMWLSHPLSPLHLLHPVKRDLEVRKHGWREGPHRTGRITYYSPFTLLPSANKPLLRSRSVVRRSSLATTPSLRRVLRKAGFGKPDLIWLTNPVFQPVASALDTPCRVVRVADATASFSQVPEAVRELEEEAICAANVVFAVSEQESVRIDAEREGVVRLPNGVDFAHFAQMRDEPIDLHDIPYPRVIYVGAIEYWFDSGMLAETARDRPDTSFVLIGPARASLGDLESLPNVHLLGPRPYEDVPAYLQHADAAIVPFARDDMVDAIHPIKVYEYLAAGLPVLATRWTELERMDAPVTLTDRDGFAAALSDVLAEKGPSRETRLRYARENSWDARFDIVLETLRPFLAEETRP